MQQLTRDRRRHLPVLFVFFGLILFLNLFSASDYQLLSAVVKLRIAVGYAPETRIILPPVGQIGASTHWLPVRLSVELRSVDLGQLQTLVFSPALDPDALPQAVWEGSLRILVLFAIRLVGLGAAGPLLLNYCAGDRNPKKLVQSGAAGALLVMLLIALLYFTFDVTGFERLEYEGMIQAAPWVLSMAWEAFDQVEELGSRVQALAGNLYSLLQEVENLGPLGLVQADVTVLHVSDIHNNPVAYNFAKQVVDSFPVDFIMDTGDLTDWGTALEMEIAKRIEDVRLPYLFVTGNHDSPEVLKKLSAIANAVLISQEETAVAGLRIAGTGDLVADSFLATPASPAENTAYARELNKRWSEVEERPDIFMVHNHLVAEALEPGLFPVVAYGHTHAWGVKERDGTVYSNAGTTGAAGIRGFQAREPLPYSLSLLYFSRDEGGRLRLQAVDGVHVTGLGTSFSLHRTFVQSRNSDDSVEVVR
ncbi:MAG: metallophosphoesterase [Bacillota bacterium]|nr:metallophosphoesterase [Bacillota bacterium]